MHLDILLITLLYCTLQRLQYRIQMAENSQDDIAKDQMRCKHKGREATPGRTAETIQDNETMYENGKNHYQNKPGSTEQGL